MALFCQKNCQFCISFLNTRLPKLTCPSTLNTIDYPNCHALCFTVLVKEIRMLLHKILQPIAQLCSDSTKGSTFCCIQRLLMMSLHVYVTLLNKKILTCLLGKKEMKTSRGNSGPKTQCCCLDLETPFFQIFNEIIQSSVNFEIHLT